MGDNSYQGSDVERRTFLKVAGGAAATAAFSGVASAQDRQPGTLDDDRRVIVGIPNSRDLDGFIQRVNRGQADAIPTDASVVKYNRQLGYAVLTVPAGSPRTQDSLLVAAQREDAVKYAERDDPEYDVPDPVPSALQESEERDDQVSILATPSDPKFSDQYAPQLVNAPAAWDTTQGSSDVVISVVDQGALYTHPDLEDRFGSLKGKDFVDGDDDPKPTDLSNEYHGTHVAGICAASIGNGTGIAGMSNSTLLSCRALSTQGGRPSDIADAVQWSADQGADIINMSLGGGGSNSTMQNAINYAVNNGALPIAAAGNSGQEEIQYPAGYEKCMAVSAVDSAESLASFSTFGSNIDVAAPGVDILSTWTEDGGRSGSISGKYAKISGTSMACPATSGVAALGKAANPSWGPSELRQQLKNTAVDIGLAQNKQGAGRVDAQKLIGGTESDDQKPTPSFTVDITDPHVEETVVLESTASDAKGFIDAYEWEFSDGTTKSGKNVKHTFSTTGDKTITHTVTDDEGETASSTKTVTVQAGGPGEKQNSETFSGTISQGGGRSENTYNFQFDPSSLEVTIDTSVDFAWGLSHNGEVYTPSSGSDTVTVQDFNLYPDKAVTLIVVSTEQAGNPTGSYTLNLTEYGFGDGGTENQAPTADFSVDDATVETNTQVTFDASAASDPDGTIETYSWDFGDSTQKTGEVVTHSYASAGDYSATLTVTDDGGKRDQASTTIQVSDPTSQDPTAAFTLSSSTITAGDSVTADPSGSSDDGTITSYEWAWGDGSSETTGSATSVSHTYDSSGSYDIILTVTDDDGNSSSTSRTLTVEQASDGGENVTEETSSLSGYWDSTAYTVTTTLDSPDSMTFELVGPSSADFDLYVTTDGRTPSAYDYDERSASYGSQETVEITSGVTSSSEFGVLVDSYDGSGDYTLTITETGSGGGGGGDPNEGPTAAATADPTEAETGTTITFDASGSSDSDGSISSYEWSLGDGTSKSGATVQHSYDSADTYNASVTVTDDDGATDSASVAVTINEPSGGGGSEEVTEVTGSLSGYWDEDQWDYTPQTSSPSQLTIELDGPSSADFDLYASLNEDPSTWDNDKESESLGSQEQIVLENFDASDEVNVMVTPYEGSGSYTLTLTETSN